MGDAGQVGGVDDVDERKVAPAKDLRASHYEYNPHFYCCKFTTAVFLNIMGKCTCFMQKEKFK